MPPTFRVALAGCLAALCFAIAVPVAHGKTAQQKQAAAAAKHRPIAFFLAKGDANACGTGCSEWIAAEGVFDTDSAKRFEAFLATVKRDDLPVYFNSPGGSIGQSVQIGLQLRKRRMTVGIGQSRPDGCTRNVRGDACHHVMRAKAEHKARLTVDGAQCLSACAYAFVGGSVRTVGKGAKLGVHSAFLADDKFDRPGTITQTHNLLRLYSVEMGVSSDLVKLAASTSSARMHILTRDETTRLGIETMPYYETNWQMFQQNDKTWGLVKSVTRGLGADNKPVYRTIDMTCEKTLDVRLRYRRDLQVTQVRPTVSLRFEGDAVSFSSMHAGLGIWSAVTKFGLLEQVAIRHAFDIVETYVVAAKDGIQTTRISTGRLSEALTELRKRCTEQKVSEAIR